MFPDYISKFFICYITCSIFTMFLFISRDERKLQEVISLSNLSSYVYIIF